MKKKKIVTFILSFVFVALLFGGFFLSPSYSQGQEIGVDPGFQGIVPCGRSSGGEAETCTLCHLVIGLHRIFSYGIFIIVMVALGVFFIAGAVYIVSFGSQELMEKAKRTMLYSMSGLVIVACAWLIINVTLFALSANPDLGVGMPNWWSFGNLSCN